MNKLETNNWEKDRSRENFEISSKRDKINEEKDKKMKDPKKKKDRQMVKYNLKAYVLDVNMNFDDEEDPLDGEEPSL